MRVLRCDYPFNWSRLSNDGIRAARFETIVLLNNDTVVLHENWLGRLAELANRPGTGTAGALLLYEDGTIQHAGVVGGFGGYADHLYLREPLPTSICNSPFISPLVRRNVLANTGACLALTRQTFEVVGEFDESLSVAGDVEFCLRAHASGLLNVFDPGVRLTHYESKTRVRGLPEADKAVLQARLREVVPEGDPFFSPNLSLSSRSPMPRL